MKRKFSKLLMVLAVCLMAFPCLTYAASPNTSAPASHSSDKVTVIPPPSNGDLYDNPRINSKSTFTSSDFTTNNSNDIRVWFDNQGSESVTVSLFKKGWLHDSKVGHFSVSAGTNDYAEYGASDGTKYYIIIDSDNGADVHGYLRAKQAD